MMNIARQILSTLFPAERRYIALITASGTTFRVTIDAPDERRAIQELDRIAAEGTIIDLIEA